MLSVKDRLRHIESVLGQAADLQLRNEVALANMMRDGDEFRDRLDRYSANNEALGKKLEQYAANSAATAKKLEEHTANSAAIAKKLEEHTRESKADRKRMNKAWGDLANKLGSVAEDVVAPNIPRMAVEDFGIEQVEDQVVNPYRVSRRGPQRFAEYDIICAGSGKNSPGKVIVVEVKSTPTVEKILDVPRRLAEFFDFYPEYEGREVIGVFASWSIPENLLPVISKAGLYGIAMGDETMGIVARPGTLH